MYDLEELACVAIICSSAAVLAENKTKKTKRTREWVKSWKLRRQENSSYQLLHSELRLEDKDAYRRYLRMDEDCFLELLGYVRSSIQKSDSCMRSAIPAEESLSMCLRFLATGECFRSLEYQSRLSLSFISNIMMQCCTVIFCSLKNEFLKVSTYTYLL